MIRFVYTIILVGISAVIVVPYLAYRPEILEDLAEAALVRCEIDEQLSVALANVGINQDQRHILDAIAQGEKVLVGDVRDVGDRIKNVVKAAAWDYICKIAGG